MKRYSTIQAPTIIGLRDHLNDLIQQGFGTSIVLLYDPDTYKWEVITGYTYDHEDEIVKLYCDDNE